MIDWNEHNFLENLTPQLGQKCGGPIGPCPDAETLCAVIEGLASGPERDAVMEHLSQCAACAELRGRLLNFESVSLPEPEVVRNQTRTRLDNWLEGFLRSEAAQSRSPEGGKPSWRVSGWESISNFFTPRKIVWAFGVAVVLVLIVDGVLLLEYRRAQLPQVQVATRAPTPPTPPANPAAEQEPPEKSTQKPKITPQEEGLPKAGNNLPSRAESTIRPKVGEPSEPFAPTLTPAPADHNLPSEITEGTPPPPPTPALPSAPPDHNLPTETAQATVPPATSNSEKAPISSPLEPLQHPTGRSAPITPISPSLRGERAVETAQTSGMAPSVGPEGPGGLSSRRATPSGMRSLIVSRGGAPAPAARTEHLPAIPAPPVIRLDAGTRVWIALKSVRPRADGVSEFRGVVLLPVTQSGAVLLKRNTEVSGTMTVRNGKRSVQILEFLSTEAHYGLRSASGEANLRLLGAGEAVEFDAGRVLETWMASASTYEKLSAESKPPK